jgi:hypothetical protein
MAQDATQVVVAGSGNVYVGPLTTPEPNTEVATPDTDWVDLGYTTPDGVTFSLARTVTDIDAWQSFDPIRKIVSGIVTSLAFSLRQWNVENLPFALGGGVVTEESAGEYLFTPPDPSEIDERSMLLRWIDNDKHYQLYVPKGIVTGTATFQMTRSDAVNLPVEFSPTRVDADTALFLIRTDDPAFEALGS